MANYRKYVEGLIFHLFLIVLFNKLPEVQNNDWTFGAENIWSFRNDNQNNQKVKATFTSRQFKDDLWDFTICFRFRVLYFNPSNNGINILLAKYGKEKLHFRVFPRPTPHKLEIKVAKEKHDSIKWIIFRIWKGRDITER